MYRNRQNKGITLIALVITIIILLILAGVSIAMLIGENGLLTKARSTGRATEKAEAEERIKLVLYDWYIAKYAGKDGMNFETFLDQKMTNGEIEKWEKISEGVYEIEVNGYVARIDDDGNIIGEVQKARPKPVIDESSIVITLEDGTAIPVEGADEGTKLKITLTATIEGGTITSAEPTGARVENGTITYITEGTEKEITITVKGTIEGDEVTTSYKIPLKDKYKKNEFVATDIKNKAQTFYGSEVTNYICPNTSGVKKWRIFYADDTNIYLIADDYINLGNAPRSANHTLYTSDSSINNCHLSFKNVYNDYTGSEWILGTTTEDGITRENSLAKKWLNKYFNYTADNGATYPNRTSTNTNIRAVAFMMDTKIWGDLYKGEDAEYAIGGPTIEMYVASYKDSHPSSSINCDVKGTKGYQYSNASGLSSDCNGIYIKSEDEKADSMWIASPCSGNDGSSRLIYALYSGSLSNFLYTSSTTGLRPIVCLKSGIQLKKKSNGVYEIKK